MKRKKMYYFFVIIMALYKFPRRFSGYISVTFLYVYFIPFLYLMWNLSWTIKFIKKISASLIGISIILYGGLLTLSLAWPFLHGTFEFSFVTEYWRRFFLLLLKNTFLVAIYEKYFSFSDRKIEEYFKYYVYAMILYIAFTGVLIICKPLRNVLIGCLYLTKKNKVDLTNPTYYTRFGWAGWSGFDATMLCSLGVCFSCIMIVIRKNETKQKNTYLFLIMLLLIGNMFYGRTGLVVSLVCIGGVFFSELVKGHIKFIIPLIISGFVGVILLLVLKERIPKINGWFNWAFSAFYNLFTKGQFRDNTGSVGVLLDRMYWLPSWNTLLVGDGYYNLNDSYYMHTDSGIMRLILYYGIINYLLGWFAVMFVIQTLIKKMGMLTRKTKMTIWLILVLFIALFEIKGETYYKIVSILIPIVYLGMQSLSKSEI